MRKGLVVLLMLIAVLLTAPGTASAQPVGGKLVGVRDLSATRTEIAVASAAMNRVIRVQVLHPAGGGSRGTYYLLDGLFPGEEQSTWTNATDAEAFFRGKNVNVVLPLGGLASYYTDWQRPDPVLGDYKWETFLTRELPPMIDARFGGNGANAIGGLSMGGGAAFTLASRNPWLYRAVAGYSACPDNTMAMWPMIGSIALRGANPFNMWGPPGDPAWAAHDPSVNAEALRGKALYLWSATGIPGPHEFELKPQVPENIITGAPVEAMVNACVRAFEGRLGSLGIPARFAYQPVGTHSWGYWRDALHDSWPTIGPAIGA
ncbi:MAG TPA: alpha/beta hydrolase family protein [Aldersonia sp.]